MVRDWSGASITRRDAPATASEVCPEPRTCRGTERAITAFVVLGIVLRIARYATNQPLWGDEAYLAASLIERGFLGLLSPLDYHQVAPPLFLWTELAVVRLFGFAEWSLRLVPLLCGVASVPLFAWLARRSLGGRAALPAVGIFAVAFYPIRHATEVKPYATDLLAALLLLAPAIAWWRNPGSARPLWVLAALLPVTLWFSYPAVFVAGGIGLALLPMVVRSGRIRVLAAYVAYGTFLLGAFSVLYVVVIRGQTTGAGSGTHQYWAEAFPPPLDEPLSLLTWLVEVHTSRMFAYPIGEANGGSVLTTVLTGVGMLVLYRRGGRGLLAILVMPFLIGFAAAFLGRYPYGGSARTMQYVAPAICLLAGLGAARLIEGVRDPARRRRLVLYATGTLAAIGVVCVGGEIARPYKFPEDERARQFARRFWSEQAEGARLACVRRDLGTTIDPFHWETGRSAVYLCNQAIYRSRNGGERGSTSGDSRRNRPLRCVLYNVDRDHPDLNAWLAEMTRNYRLQRILTFQPVPKAIVGGLEYEDRYDVYEFLPDHPTASGRVAFRDLTEEARPSPARVRNVSEHGRPGRSRH